MGGCCSCRVPRRLRSIPLLLVLAFIAWLYSSFVRFAQPSLFAFGASLGEVLLAHALVWMVAAALSQVLCSYKSFLPQQEQEEMLEKDSDEEDTEVEDARARPEPHAVEVKANGRRRYCRRCRVWKPDRAHHCSSCGRCVLKMDHHCALLNKCIGYYNYKFFLQFVGWSAVGCLYIASLVLRYMLMRHLDHAAALFVYGRLKLMTPSLQIVLVFFMGACMGAALLCFFFMHLMFTARNYTTLEFCEKRRDGDYINYYSLAPLRNLGQVFGTAREVPYWFLPIPTPSVMNRDAGIFPVNSKFSKTD